MAPTIPLAGSAALLRSGWPKRLPLFSAMQHIFCCPYPVPTFMQQHSERAKGEAL